MSPFLRTVFHIPKIRPLSSDNVTVMLKLFRDRLCNFEKSPKTPDTVVEDFSEISACVQFDHRCPQMSQIAKAFKERRGWLKLKALSFGPTQYDSYLLCSSFSDAGELIDLDQLQCFISSAVNLGSLEAIPENIATRFQHEIDNHTDATIAHIEYTSKRKLTVDHLIAELSQDNERLEVCEENRNFLRQQKIDVRRRRSKLTVVESDKLQIKVEALDTELNIQRQHIIDIEDRIDQKRNELILAVEQQNKKETMTIVPLFTIRWSVV